MTRPFSPAMRADGVAATRARDQWKASQGICIAIAVLFFVKFAAFGLYLTPFWDIPDESGHFSYVEDLSHGHLPILGEARVSREVTDSWIAPDARQGRNWIAQHPPLFYALAAPVVAGIRAAGGDFDAQVHGARLVSASVGALAILGLMGFLTLATGRALLGVAGGVFIGATPMFTQLGSGVTHDTLVACTAAWACYWFLRWLRSDKFGHALSCAFIAGLCCVTKITGLALAIPLFFSMAFWMLRLRGFARPWPSLVRSAIVWLVMFAPVLLWAAHNLVHFHQMFPDARLLHVYPDNPTEMGWLEYMQRYPIWQNVLLNFVGLLGWMGTVPRTVVTVQANGFIALAFVTVFLFCSLLAILHTFRSQREGKHGWAWIAVLAVACILLGSTMSTYRLATITCATIFVATLWVGAASVPKLRGEPSVRSWLVLTGCACILFFSVLYYHRIWEGYIQIGRVKALHGRYFYTVMPFLALLMLWPLRKRWLPVAAVAIAALALVVSDGFFLHDAFVMYGKFQ
ncbi:MAG TPA: glycosyltransferase family 39 protein [Luteimonas sp.]|nr:glycosyltransferase family 39 protein [Luteimonas sp.]